MRFHHLTSRELRKHQAGKLRESWPRRKMLARNRAWLISGQSGRIGLTALSGRWNGSLAWNRGGVWASRQRSKQVRMNRVHGELRQLATRKESLRRGQ